MAFALQYYEEVEADLMDAISWYSTQKDGLEVEFAAVIWNALEHIVQAPRTFAVRYKNVRIAHPTRFPYNIHFYLDEPNTTVVVIAIVHSRRHPNIGRKVL